MAETQSDMNSGDDSSDIEVKKKPAAKTKSALSSKALKKKAEAKPGRTSSKQNPPEKSGASKPKPTKKKPEDTGKKPTKPSKKKPEAKTKGSNSKTKKETSGSASSSDEGDGSLESDVEPPKPRKKGPKKSKATESSDSDQSSESAKVPHRKKGWRSELAQKIRKQPSDGGPSGESESNERPVKPAKDTKTKPQKGDKKVPKEQSPKELEQLSTSRAEKPRRQPIVFSPAGMDPVGKVNEEIVIHHFRDCKMTTTSYSVETRKMDRPPWNRCTRIDPPAKQEPLPCMCQQRRNQQRVPPPATACNPSACCTNLPTSAVVQETVPRPSPASRGDSEWWERRPPPPYNASCNCYAQRCACITGPVTKQEDLPIQPKSGGSTFIAWWELNEPTKQRRGIRAQ